MATRWKLGNLEREDDDQRETDANKKMFLEACECVCDRVSICVSVGVYLFESLTRRRKAVNKADSVHPKCPCPSSRPKRQADPVCVGEPGVVIKIDTRQAKPERARCG